MEAPGSAGLSGGAGAGTPDLGGFRGLGVYRASRAYRVYRV